MNIQHTLGPWTFNHHLQQIEAGGKVIAVINTIEERGEANGLLLAAAPELLMACELASQELNKMDYECDCEDLPTLCPVCAVNRAIAKTKRG